jgi:hypothetical protein
MIQDNANLALFLLHDILDSTMIKKGKIRIVRENFSIF